MPLKYKALVEVIDDYHFTKEIIACYFKKLGYIASFLPKILSVGSGAHAHLSIWKDGKNIMGDPNNKYNLS